MKQDYEICGYIVEMTPGAAARWNEGNLTEWDLRNSILHVPEPWPLPGRYITLRRATCERLEPEIAKVLNGFPANRTAGS